jgi:hypothetical protein
MRAVASACKSVTVPGAGSSSTATPASSTGTLYDCRGHGAALAGAGRSTS